MLVTYDILICYHAGTALLAAVLLFFAEADLVLLHAEVVGVFVPDGLGDNRADIKSVLMSRFFYRQFIERDGVRECGTHAVGVAARGIRDALIEPQECLAFIETLLLPYLLGRLVLDQERDIPYPRTKFLRYQQKSLLHQLLELFAGHAGQCISNGSHGVSRSESSVWLRECDSFPILPQQRGRGEVPREAHNLQTP